jgi:hypothetical protein
VPDPLADLAQLPGVPSAVAAATAAVDVVLRDRGLRRVTDQVRAEALLASAEGSARLTSDPERWRPGAERLSAELPALADLVRVAPGQALARAHTVVARGVVPNDELGRMSGNAAAAGRMRDLIALLTSGSSAPAVVLGAVVHAEIATVEAFGAASGLLARAAEHLVLISGGLDPSAVIPVEAGHAADAADYRAGLDAYAGGETTGVGRWLLWCAVAVARGAELSPVAASRRTPPTVSERREPRALGLDD